VNYIVLLTCAVCLVTYMVMAVILRKLDQLDVRRVRIIPFCGKRGRFKYEILVKTGWGRGSGEWVVAVGRDPGSTLVWSPAAVLGSDWSAPLMVIMEIGVQKQGLSFPSAVRRVIS
jgi:hypothetical protein